MSGKADVVSAEGVRRFLAIALVATALWAMVIAAGAAILYR